MFHTFVTFILLSLPLLAEGPSLYERNYFGLDWGRGGSYGPHPECECRGEDPDCQCDK